MWWISNLKHHSISSFGFIWPELVKKRKKKGKKKKRERRQRVFEICIHLNYWDTYTIIEVRCICRFWNRKKKTSFLQSKRWDMFRILIRPMKRWGWVRPPMLLSCRNIHNINVLHRQFIFLFFLNLYTYIIIYVMAWEVPFQSPCQHIYVTVIH